MRKILRVNMTEMQASYHDVPDKYKWHGGRSLIARIATDEIDPACDPLGPDNKLIIASTIFAGTPISTGNRVSVGGKSPLTKGIKEANAGGTAGIQLAKQAIKAIIVEGTPKTDDLYIIYIDKTGKADILAANEYKGMCNFELVQKLKERFSDDISVMCAGLAGERKNVIASVMVTDQATGQPVRAAARGGMGAVMGSKGIKAIVIEKPSAPYKREFADEKRLLALNKEYVKLLLTNPMLAGRNKVGTSGGVKPKEAKGIIPVKNFRSMPFPDVKGCDAEAFYEHVLASGGKAGLVCQPGCVIRCSQVFNRDGKFFSSGVQYETIGLCGTNLMIGDIDKIAEISTICDDYGIDTIDLGAAIGIFMEAGILEWGDSEGTLKLLGEMVRGDTEYGRLLPSGIRNVGKALKVDRLPETKGQAFAAYDPRATPTHGAQFMWGTHGGDHTQGGPVPDKEGNWKTNEINLPLTVALDSCMCLFGQFPILFDGKHEFLKQFIESIYGGEWSVEKVFSILGDDTITLELRFNEKAGVGGVEKLPEFFYTEKSVITGKVCKYPLEQFDELQQYYIDRELTQKEW